MTALKRLFFLAIGLFLALPLIVVAGVSVNEKQTLAFPPQGFSLSWYGEIFTNNEWRSALVASLVLAATVITALGLLTFWATSGFYGQPWTAVIGHAIFFVTLPLVTLSLGFSAIDRSLVEAAATMGADDRTIFHTVIFPLILPYMVSGYAFAFVLSLNEYIVAYMTVGFTMETLPIKIFNALRYGYTPTMASVTVFFLAIAALVFGAIARFGDLPKLLGAMTNDR